LLAVAHGGVGVRILNAPEAYYNFMKVLGIGAKDGELEAESSSAEASHKDAAAGAGPQQRYRVRAKQTQGPRSRILDVAASSEEDARNRALTELGEGWQVLQVEFR
jgi:hypothetical protein